MNKINSLTGMRFIAIMIIVISHFEFLRNHYFVGDIYWKFFHNATMGVDFFFILSGFGMMLSDINRNGLSVNNEINIKNLFAYGTKHIKKIYPLYITTILIGIPLYFYHAITSGKSVFLIIELCIIKLIACVFLVQSAFGFSWLSHSFNGVCWFLSCLFCIYLVSPLYINILKRFCTSIKKTGLLLISLPILSSILAFLFHQVENISCFDDFAYGSPYRRIVHVVFGMVLAILITKYKDNLKIKHINLCEIITSSIAILWFIFRNTIRFIIPYISLIYIIDIIVVGLIILCLALNRGIISQLLSTPKIVYLGELSMYIFLIHYPIRMYLGELCKYNNWNMWYIAILLILVICIMTYYISKYLYLRTNKNEK